MAPPTEALKIDQEVKLVIYMFTFVQLYALEFYTVHLLN